MENNIEFHASSVEFLIIYLFFLIYVCQEDTLFSVLFLVQWVMPVFCLDKTGEENSSYINLYVK